jgi:elongation factor P
MPWWRNWYTRWSQKPMGFLPVWVRVPPTAPLLIMIASELKTGRIFKDGNDPCIVLKYTHIQMGRGGTTVKIKYRNLLNGNVLETSFNPNDKVEEADLSRKNAQYLYNDGQFFVFMDPNTYVQVQVNPEVLGDNAVFLMEEHTVSLTYFEGKVINVELPQQIVLEVTYTEPGFKGNTVTNSFKDAELENGYNAKVPMFISIGDKIKIDTRTGEYVSKA